MKQLEESTDNSQYCQMEPQIQRKVTLAANEYTEQEVEILNKFNELNVKSDEINNCLNISDKQSDQTIQQILIQC